MKDPGDLFDRRAERVEYDEDPEVLADARLREESQRDRTRTRGMGIYAWKPPEDVAFWPCRRPGCGIAVGVTEEAVHALGVHNAELRRRGEREIPTDAIALCPDCKVVHDEVRHTKKTNRLQEIYDLVKRMRESPTPHQEHDMIRRLTELKHPDVPDLIKVLQKRLERLAGKKTTRAKGAGL